MNLDDIDVVGGKGGRGRWWMAHGRREQGEKRRGKNEEVRTLVP